MKLKFADPESITFMKKIQAKAWLRKQWDYVLEGFGDHTSGCRTVKYDVVINDANDVYFWFTATCHTCGCVIYGTIVHWKKKRWVLYGDHTEPKPRERKGQLLFAGC